MGDRKYIREEEAEAEEEERACFDYENEDDNIPNPLCFCNLLQYTAEV